MRSRENAGSGPIILTPIGVIHSEHVKVKETPIQSTFAQGCQGTVELLPEYEKGLKDIEEFSHLILLYHFHKAGPVSLVVKPFLDDKHRGLFATRHPCRPNAIGLSVVRLLRREETTLFLEDVDMLDETPLLDIKPYFPQHDAPEGAQGGWAEAIDPIVARVRGRRGYRGQKPSENGKEDHE